MCDVEQRIRLLILGGPGVGKTAIVKRFLFDAFSERYKTTVEELYSREIDLGVTTLGVDIMDTCGDFQFPAMRHLSIATSHAFLFVYSTTSLDSFHIVKTYFEEFKEFRSDFQDLPVVVVGNKSDLATHFRQVQLEDVSEWLYCQQPKLKVKLMECSAKDNYNIRDIFTHFVTLSRVVDKAKDESSLKRRSSAYVRASSSTGAKSGNRPSVSSGNSLSVSSAAGGSGEGPSGSGTQPTSSTSSTSGLRWRSRSLIRRSSRKSKQIRENVIDCNIS